MKTIYHIAMSLCSINDWEIKRLDIQKWQLGEFEGYTGYLYVNDKIIMIRGDGTFEYK